MIKAMITKKTKIESYNKHEGNIVIIKMLIITLQLQVLLTNYEDHDYSNDTNSDNSYKDNVNSNDTPTINYYCCCCWYWS